MYFNYLNYFRHNLAVLSSGFQLSGLAHSKGHNIDFGCHEIINGLGKKKRQSSATKICFNCLDISVIVIFACEIMDYFTVFLIETIRETICII